MKRIYHPVHEWEEIAANMWGTVDDREGALETSVQVTGQPTLYGLFMRRVLSEWPVSCENALSDRSINRKAWIGHAAIALGFAIPEDVVRQAWGYLSDEQRKLANAEAAYCIETWERSQAADRNLHQDVGGQMLFNWDSGGSSRAVG